MDQPRTTSRHRAAFDLRSDFTRAQRRLARFNIDRLTPRAGETFNASGAQSQLDMLSEEEAFIKSARDRVAPLLSEVPSDSDKFLEWFTALKETGPGAGDPLFPWLAAKASHAQMRWFLLQEVAGEAGFEDLVALTQIKMPVRAKLEMARNYWDEMGRGQEKGMHGPMLKNLAGYFDIEPSLDTSVPETLALGNMMLGLAFNRRYAYQSVGALGAIELTAPTRAVYVVEGLRRLGVPEKKSHYFALHSVLDVKHAEAWNHEVLHSLVEADPTCGRPIGEGALLRLWCGAQCFERYRAEFGV